MGSSEMVQAYRIRFEEDGIVLVTAANVVDIDSMAVFRDASGTVVAVAELRADGPRSPILSLGKVAQAQTYRIGLAKGASVFVRAASVDIGSTAVFRDASGAEVAVAGVAGVRADGASLLIAEVGETDIDAELKSRLGGLLWNLLCRR